MRATLTIPDNLIEEVQRLSGERTKTGAIVTAMEAFVRQKKIAQLLTLKGTAQIEDVTPELERLELQEMEENDRAWRAR